MAEKHPALNTMKHEGATPGLKRFSCCGCRLESRNGVLLFLGTLGAAAEVLMGPTQAFRVASLQGAYNKGLRGLPDEVSAGPSVSENKSFSAPEEMCRLPPHLGLVPTACPLAPLFHETDKTQLTKATHEASIQAHGGGREL